MLTENNLQNLAKMRDYIVCLDDAETNSLLSKAILLLVEKLEALVEKLEALERRLNKKDYAEEQEK